MNFLNKVKSSIYGPDFYADLANEPVGKSFRYYFELASVIALLTAIIFSVFVVPKIRSFLDDFGTSIVSGFPTELEVRLVDGKVTTNAVEPYIVPVPEDFVVEDTTPEYENMIVINTKESFDLQRFNEYSTFALITDDSFVYENESGRVSIQNLSTVPNVTINKANVSDWVNKTQPFVSAVPFVLPVLAFLAILIAFAFNLIYIAIVSVLVMLVLRLKKIETSYKHAYKVSLHAYTLPMLLSFLFTITGVGSLALFPTVVLLVIVLINFKQSPAQVVAQ